MANSNITFVVRVVHEPLVDRLLLSSTADAALRVLTTQGRGVLGDLSPSRAHAVAVRHADNRYAITAALRNRAGGDQR